MNEYKLLSARFASTGGTLVYNLGCQSSDGIPINTAWTISSQKPLNQVGCNFIVPDSRNESYYPSHLNALHTCFEKAGYGIRNPFLNSVLDKNIRLYLNGVPNFNGVDMPWVQWEDGSYCTILVYYTANGTRIGPLWSNLIGTSGGNYCSFIAGQLFIDGTFKGCAGPVKHHRIPLIGTDSLVDYEWACTDTFDEPVQILNPAIASDLSQYLPREPEGEFTDEGNGDFDDTSDPIDYPDLPTFSVLSTGMLSMYEMTPVQLKALSNYLWTSNFETNLAKLFNDPMEAIVNLCMSPVDLTGDLLTTNIKIGNVTTTCQGQRVHTPYKIMDFGTIHLREYWANFGDYSPYTQLSIYLPYVGVQKISIDDVMNGEVQLKGYCDVLTGSIVYMLLSVQGNRRGHGHESVLYTWSGNTQYQIPITASNMSSVISSLISTTGMIAGGIGATVATGGLTAPIAIGQIGSAVGSVMSAKTHVQRSGGLGGATGMFAVQKPYLILERPEQIAPENYAHTVGIPCEKTDYLKNYAGYVKIKGVDLKIDGASKNELLEIERLLKEGVYI